MTKIKKCIYKIENKINKKVYIGQTNDYNSRCGSHRCTLNKNKHDNIYLQRAWNKYGEDNFKFEIIEDYTENYNEMERYYINLYKSTKQEYGYNNLEGGDSPPIKKGEKHSLAKFTELEIKLLKDDLKYSDLTRREIATKYGYKGTSTIDRINSGKLWHDSEESYPLRYKFSKNMVDYIFNSLANTSKSQQAIANEMKVSRSTITMINIGLNHKREDIIYPIRK